MHKNIFQNKIGKAFAVVAVAGMILSGNGMPWMAADAYAAVDLAQIPEYTGSPYTVINDNEPEFEADDFSTEAFENMPSHPCDFSRELDGYRFLNT